MVNRREFLHRTTAAAGAAGLAPLALRAMEQFGVDSPPMPDPNLYTKNEDEYWRQIRRQFILPENTIYLNVGTVGCSPAPVLRAVFQCYVDIEKMQDVTDPEEYPIWGYAAHNNFRDPLAKFVGVTRDELALVRNATEGNNFMIHGLDMKPGDEVLMSDQEHGSGESPWYLRSRRHGIVVKKYEIPKPLTRTEELLNRINDAITPRTRVLFTSHITTATGVIQPVKEICALARTKGLVSMVDGAQAPGMLRLNIRELGCDMYSASPHKWLMAPKGTGFLYVSESILDRVWSTVTTHGWDKPKLRAESFQHFGSSNIPVLAGLIAAIDFANAIGMERIEKRHRALNDVLRAEMLRRGAEDWTGQSHAFRCAMVAVNTPPIQIMDLERAFWAQHRIRIRGGAPYKIRLSTPYWLQKNEMARFLEKFDAFKRSYRPAA
jgi:selenocysteine lyase/cysteine desulfurase